MICQDLPEKTSFVLLFNPSILQLNLEQPFCQKPKIFISFMSFRYIVNQTNLYTILENTEFRKSSSRLEAVQVSKLAQHFGLLLKRFLIS